MVKHFALALVPVILGVSVGCRPELEDRTFRVASPRVLAVRATPAEAKPGETVRLEAIVGDGRGTVRDANVDWALCIERAALSTAGPIAEECRAATSPALVPLGVAAAVDATIPLDACRLFGPDRPEPKPGEPAGRPADPDATGGYFQPLRLIAPDGLSIADVRIQCGLSGATQEQVAAYGARATPNANPVIETLELGSGVALATEDAPGTPIARGATVRLRVRYAPPETYVFFDPATRALVDRREAMRVAWLATAGALAEDRTGHPESEAAAVTTENTFTAPDQPGDVVLWVVLRDDRGGVVVRSARFTVQ